MKKHWTRALFQVGICDFYGNGRINYTSEIPSSTEKYWKKGYTENKKCDIKKKMFIKKTRKKKI